MSTGPRVIVALDYATAGEALAFARRVTPAQCRLKVGLELFTAAGPALVAQLRERGFDVFLDLKFHDIPNTVARACAQAAELGVWMMNVHTLGGGAMMRAARDALNKPVRPEVSKGERSVITGSEAVRASIPQHERRQDAPDQNLAFPQRRPLLIGVTMLTSHGEADAHELGLTANLAGQVDRLAGLAQAAGLDGVVCSAHEAAGLRARFGKDFVLVTPGIRPAGSDHGDQSRVMTPAQALAAGSDYLVIGRPITQSPDPLAVLEAVNREIAVLQPA